MNLKAIKPFSWAHRGVEVVEYQEGDIIETDDEDLIKVSVDEGWAEQSKESGSKTVKEIKEELTAAGIEFKSDATKAELLALLEKKAN